MEESENDRKLGVILNYLEKNKLLQLQPTSDSIELS